MVGGGGGARRGPWEVGGRAGGEAAPQPGQRGLRLPAGGPGPLLLRLWATRSTPARSLNYFDFCPFLLQLNYFSSALPKGFKISLSASGSFFL